MITAVIRFCLYNRLVVGLVLLAVLVAGYAGARFDWRDDWLPRSPVAVDAIPDLGENQQVVFTQWPGRSPQDIEDQITYPLTVALLGLPDVATVRSVSMFGFSSIYVIFKERADFYDTRSRILEKLASLSPEALPADVRPVLGPDATALGQVFWYTLEGRDPDGNPAGGWDLDELRSAQDWYVRYALMSVEGVSEVASVGGFVREYQIDVDPDAMRSYGVRLDDVFRAVRESNVDVGARTIEINRVEYVVRGVGFVKTLSDLETVVVKVIDNVPVTLRDIAVVATGPALRRGVLDKGGVEAVGGVVVARFGENPLAVIDAVKVKIDEISPGLPTKTLADGTVSKLTVVPFYDRSGLIRETLATLDDALRGEILLTIIVVVVMVMRLRGGLLVSGLLPMAVLMAFIGMRVFGVDANIVALSGIAIAIGTMVDMGVVVTENILRHLDRAVPGVSRRETILIAASEVGPAVVTAVATTIVSFLPVFTLQAAEGKLFQPLAWTKTFALTASVIVALALIPPMADFLMGLRLPRPRNRRWLVIPVVLGVGLLLAEHWRPLGVDRHLLFNLLFVGCLTGGLLWFFHMFLKVYPRLLGWCLRHKAATLAVPFVLVVLGALAWSGLGEEFMPPLDEGSYLYMPTTMPHASIGEAQDVLSKLDKAMAGIPEVSGVVGKLGRVDSPLDPAPVSMIESVVNYLPEYRSDANGRVLRFAWDADRDDFVRDELGDLIPDRRGRPYRQWRPEIRSVDDIWDEIVRVTQMPGTTSAPKLQPISTRLVMLQSGMRAPMGVKVSGPDLASIEVAASDIERALKEVPSVSPATVVADRVVGKPYLEIRIDREAIARYGLSIRKVQDVIEVAVGGRALSTSVEGRERYPIRVRYARESRDDLEDLGRVIVTAPDGTPIPLLELASIEYVRGPQSIKSEDTFLTGYVLFDKHPGHAEVDVVEDCTRYLEAKVAAGALVLPTGVSYRFAGSFENQVRSAKRLRLVLPAALLIIFLILYLQFRSTLTTGMVFSGIFVAWAGGFLLIWLYGQPWFLDVTVLGIDLRHLFQIHPLNLSVAVWVGFIALFGIATDDGVIMATYLDRVFHDRRPDTREAVREATVSAGVRRVRPALMTTATTILALLPVLTSQGRGSDIMVPMAIPSFGGMIVEVLTMLVVPVLYCLREERRLKHRNDSEDAVVIDA